MKSVLSALICAAFILGCHARPHVSTSALYPGKYGYAQQPDGSWTVVVANQQYLQSAMTEIGCKTKGTLCTSEHAADVYRVQKLNPPQKKR